MSRLFTKTLIVIIILFGIIATFTSILSGWNIYRGLTQDYTSKGISIANGIADSSVEILINRSPATLQSIIDQYLDIKGVSYLLVADHDGKIISHTFVPSVPNGVLNINNINNTNLIRDENTIRHISIKNYGDFIDISSPILGGIAGFVQVGMNKKLIKGEIYSIILKQQLLIFIIFLITIAISYFLINRISLPLLTLRDYVKHFATDSEIRSDSGAELIKSIADNSHDEIGELATSFLQMENELKDYIGKLTETTAANERIESELKIAHEIQMSFLPMKFPPFPERKEFEIFADIKPARHVGGDFYDFYFIDRESISILNNKLFFVIGDVSGKGVPASLFMALTKTLLKSKTMPDLEPGEVLSNVNKELCVDNDSCMFVTVFCGVLDIESGEVRYSNGGHNPPYLVSKSKGVMQLNGDTGTALGIFEEARYVTNSIKLHGGDRLYLYTDGVTEAVDSNDNMFSEDRLELLLTQHIDCRNTRKLVNDSCQEIITFSSGIDQFDDITVMAIKYN